jgi:hypothetical protein
MARDIEILMRRYPDASKLALRDYVETMLTNEKVLEILENATQ